MRELVYTKKYWSVRWTQMCHGRYWDPTGQPKLQPTIDFTVLKVVRRWVGREDWLPS